MSTACKGKPYFEEKVCELRNYKFVLGIENTLMDDYVTESASILQMRLFFFKNLSAELYHALWAGAVPVYWGPPNVADFLPENGAINIASFNGNVRALGALICLAVEWQLY